MVGEKHAVAVRWSWAFPDRSAGAQVGPFRDRLLRREDEGILDLAAAEDKALLRSHLSAAAVQWHGDAACTGRRPLVHTMLLAQSEKSQGFGDRSPRATEVR